MQAGVVRPAVLCAALTLGLGGCMTARIEESRELPTQIASGAAAANAGTSDSGTNAETRPAPLRNAAFTANKAAPG